MAEKIAYLIMWGSQPVGVFSDIAEVNKLCLNKPDYVVRVVTVQEPEVKPEPEKFIFRVYFIPNRKGELARFVIDRYLYPNSVRDRLNRWWAVTIWEGEAAFMGYIEAETKEQAREIAINQLFWA